MKYLDQTSQEDRENVQRAGAQVLHAECSGSVPSTTWSPKHLLEMTPTMEPVAALSSKEVCKNSGLEGPE